MHSVAVLSLKGGVGKSTVTLGLAGAAAARGLRTLVVDLDPQANATAALDTGKHAFTSGDVLADARGGIAADAIASSGWGPEVDVVAADRALEHRNVPEGAGSSLRLRVALSGLDTTYDLLLVDSPPSLGELTRNALAAVDHALVVTEPGYFALQGAAQALDAVSVVRSSANLRLRPVGIVVNRVRAQLAEHAYRVAELRDAYGALVLDPVVPERSCIQQAQGAARPVQSWRTPAAREVTDVFDRLLDHVLRAR